MAKPVKPPLKGHPTIPLAFAEEAGSRGRTAVTPYHPVHPGRFTALPDYGLAACREQ